MLYTVQQVADISGVTVKTLYHYHKIGLLLPQEVAANGYRYYGQPQLERLQQILFYRELGLSLDLISRALADAESHLSCLYVQQSLLQERVQEALRAHLAFLELDTAVFVAQCRFFVQDDFHRAMLESQQTGLSYYLCLAAEALASCQS